MDQTERAFEASVEDAWADFRRTLADWIDELGDGEALTFASLSGREDDDPDDDEDGPPVAVVHEHGAIKLDVHTGLLPSARRDPAAGERWGSDDPAYEPVWFEEVTSFATDRADEVAVRCVQVLREDMLVVHPSLLTTWPRTWSPSSTLRARQAKSDGAVVEPTSVAPPLAWPQSADELDRLTDVALLPLFDHAPARDDDGDLPIDTGGGGKLWLRSRPDGRVVQLYSFVVSDVADDGLGLREAARLNTDFDIVKFRYADRTLQAVVDLRAWPFVADNLRAETAAFVGFVREKGPELAERLGGRTWQESTDDDTSRTAACGADCCCSASQPEAGSAQLSEAADIVRRQLLQIEAAVAGEFDLDAAQVQRICREDPDLMLELIEHEQGREVAWAALAASTAPGGHGEHPDEHLLAMHERLLAADRLRLLRLALHATLTGG